MTVIHYTGHLQRGVDDPRWTLPGSCPTQSAAEVVSSAVAAVLKQQQVTSAFGSLACGADLLVVEAALAVGIAVQAVIPHGLAFFCAASVAPGDDTALRRFDAVLDRLSGLTILPVLESLSPADAFHLTSEWAMAMARSAATNSGERALQLALWDGKPGRQGTAADVDNWRRAGGDALEIVLPDGRIQHYATAIPARLVREKIGVLDLGGETGCAWKAAENHLPEAAVLYGARLL